VKKRAPIKSWRRRIRACTFGAAPPTQRGYDRVRDLPRLLPLLAAEIVTDTSDDHERLLALLRRALRLERNRGKGGHWTYDLARHSALLRAYRSEQAALERRQRRRGPVDNLAGRQG